MLDVIKIGIVLTLAFSWPAFRTLVHDVVLAGPAEVAALAGSSVASTDGGATFANQLQNADNAIVRLTEAGTGRNIGAFVDSEAPGGTFQGSALEDENAFGWSRLAYLAGIIGSLALLRLVAGLLLALAPLAAGLLLFDATRGLFSGWLRGLVLSLIGSVGVTIVLAAQLAIITPWLDDALRLRASGYATPSAPIELFAMTLAFAIVQFAMIWLLAKVAFTRGWITMVAIPGPQASERLRETTSISQEPPAIFAVSRAQRMADTMQVQVKREAGFAPERAGYRNLGARNEPASGSAEGSRTSSARVPDRLGTSWRRTSQRNSGAARRRDGR